MKRVYHMGYNMGVCMEPVIECNFRQMLDSGERTISGLAIESGLNKGRISEIANGKRIRNKREHERLSSVLGFEVEQWRETDVSVRVEIPPCN